MGDPLLFSFPAVRSAVMKPPLRFFASILGAWLAAGAASLMASPAPDRLAAVDRDGVMRWLDTRAEVALFGVNYYTPFWHNYPDLRTVGADHRKVIEDDVLHFARLGLDALRLHVFDREISDEQGNLISNEHLQLLDYLIAQARQRGIYTVLTPIAWWPVPGDSPGFSTRFTMPQMITDPAARAAQTNYLHQFLSRTNPLTGWAYGQDPAVVCLELINEPQYAPGTTDAVIAEYINALADAVRATGCRKPIFYNGWARHLAAVRDARVDGSTFGWYPSGLVSGRSLRRNFLPVVDQYGGSDEWNPSMRTELLAHKAKIVYEFDAADVPGSYLYPAMARAFRSGGAQIATQFQYDPLPLARFNQGWQTHFLNLVCSPQRAVSFLIAAEAFRQLPRGQDYGRYPVSTRFDAFRVSFEEDLSEMVTDRAFFHSNTTQTAPPAPDRLERIVGCGSSPVVQYDGMGAYFLEKVASGAWRLELYPDAVWLNDPFGAHRLDREVARILWRTRPLRILLKDLGPHFGAVPLNADNAFRAEARDYSLALRPGVYLLRRPGAASEAALKRRWAGRVGWREYVALPDLHLPTAVRHEAPALWVAGQPLQLSFTVVGSEEPGSVGLAWRNGAGGFSAPLPVARLRPYQYAVTLPATQLRPGALHYRLMVQESGESKVFPAGSSHGTTSSEWSMAIAAEDAPVPLFVAARHHVKLEGDPAAQQKRVGAPLASEVALQVGVKQFGPPPSAISFRSEVEDELAPWRERLSRCRTLCLRARALEATTSAVEVVLRERDGSAWGGNLNLTTNWQEVRVPLDSLRLFRHWAGAPAGRGSSGDHLQPAEVTGVNLCFGAWLYDGHAAEPHTLEIESVSLE